MDVSKPVVLANIKFIWSNEVRTPQYIYTEIGGPTTYFYFRADTFTDFDYGDWLRLMDRFYKRSVVFGMVLLFKQGDYRFTTFRAYDYRKHNYYERNIGNEFWIAEVK